MKSNEIRKIVNDCAKDELEKGNFISRKERRKAERALKKYIERSEKLCTRSTK